MKNTNELFQVRERENFWGFCQSCAQWQKCLGRNAEACTRYLLHQALGFASYVVAFHLPTRCWLFQATFTFCTRLRERCSLCSLLFHSISTCRALKDLLARVSILGLIFDVPLLESIARHGSRCSERYTISVLAFVLQLIDAWSNRLHGVRRQPLGQTFWEFFTVIFLAIDSSQIALSILFSTSDEIIME